MGALMPRVNVLQTNFTAGELTPRMKGRRDVARYQNGAETIENGIVLVHGGVERRPGLRFCAEAKHGGDREVYVLRYVFNREQAYVLEFGHLYVRIFDIDGGQLVDGSDNPIEVASPYTEDQLAEVTYHQGGDTLFLYHPDVAQHRFQRRSAEVWTLAPVPWIVEPFAEIGHRPHARLAIDNPAVGAGRTFITTASSVPGAPTGVVATPLNGAARVAFVPPADTGGAALTGFRVTSSPGGITAEGTSSPILVTGLTNGVAYTFTVEAENSAGYGTPSAASAAVTPLSSLESPTITGTITPANLYVRVPNGLHTAIPGPTASGSGGQSPYSFLWTLEPITGITGIVAGTTTDAQPMLRSSGSGRTNIAQLTCRITDNFGVSTVRSSNVSIEHETGRSPESPYETEPV